MWWTSLTKFKVEPTDAVEDEATMQQHIEKALANDSRLAQTQISCNVENGSVSLQGNVRYILSAREMAAEGRLSTWVKGVVDVINQRFRGCAQEVVDDDDQIRAKNKRTLLIRILVRV